MNLRRCRMLFGLAVSVAVGALALAQSGEPAASASNSAALSPVEIRALLDRVVTSQHRDDAAAMLYERRERVIKRKGEDSDDPAEKQVYRVVPTGTGTIHLMLSEKGKPVAPEEYRKHLRELAEALDNALHPENPRQREAIEKYEKRSLERKELVDAVPQAFRFSWLGRETRNGRRLVKLRLEPNPDFKGDTRTTDMFRHAEATMWVDEEAAQVARIEATVISNISFGGGILGKIYRGGHLTIEQAEVAPGVWLPARYVYDFEGRKFLFHFSVHETIEASGYRRIGPPREALADVRRELAGDPQHSTH